MGANLSSTFVPDLSGVVLSPQDKDSDIHLAVFWGATLYICAMIFSTCALIDRWKGPYDRIRTTGGSVIGALLLSTAWPVVMAYLMFNPAFAD
ncbi:hypothetical protein SNK03_007862 [Fusarium graminearum]|uniref:Chromosome 4, complete genome n=3 Tax=Fusarium sambucinum species complex TaxID=569360 RepID=I1RR86_GIBZE|nr:hypothetical protein FGSG_06600 [Fusarium graminearum PH-1]EYB24716.1 hypothetical protein FG05_06600 [Fusarium graminearum]KAF5239751.1 hypothetical protein FAUST_4800 [Fusarium austroamericanum]ESU12709.1 hypothetical protein FGSG_06600 [Fusarium graminearum PH-1]PCD19946.1 hypothetical protein FGRA07_05695 [Fusarium graminearum]CAF3470231.1 unnamed protein product [Fusarium graminearum]|eukprot:XP_011326216.1 hypothetical protein FGSG_06600 [Fusarium graminearum PH-1]